jgi:formaldehyde-activating enzyme
VAVKAALKMMGLDMGPPRKPLKSVGGALIHETKAEIQLELEKLGKVPIKGTSFEYPSGPIAARFGDLELSPDDVVEHELRVGSGTGGEGVNQVQIDLIAGAKTTPLGDAYALQLTYPLHRREALTTILEPALTVRPSTLLLPTLPQRNLRQANMIYGPAQSALGRAVVDALESGQIPAAAIERDVMVALVTIHPRATNRLAVAKSVRAAGSEAIREAFAGANTQDS